LFGKTLLKEQNDCFPNILGDLGPFAPPWLRLWVKDEVRKFSMVKVFPVPYLVVGT